MCIRVWGRCSPPPHVRGGGEHLTLRIYVEVANICGGGEYLTSEYIASEYMWRWRASDFCEYMWRW